MVYGMIVETSGFISHTYGGPDGTLPEGYTEIDQSVFFQIQPGYYYIDGEVVPPPAAQPS